MSGTSADGTEGVLLLHGIARRAASLRPLERRLTRAGYVTLNLDYPERRLGLADIAEVIAPTVAAFGEDVTRLHIVTHSMGGLVARVLLAQRRPDNLGRVVMLGPPNGGSEITDALHRFAAYRRFFGPAGAELGTERGAAQARLFGFALQTRDALLRRFARGGSRRLHRRRGQRGSGAAALAGPESDREAAGAT